MKYEQYYLDHYESWIETGKGYNICKVAGSQLGIKRSDETKQKMSFSLKGLKKKPLSIEHKKLISNIHKGKPKPKPKTKEYLDKMKKSHSYASKPIIGINISTNITKEYTSLHEADRDGFNRSGIKRCCDGITESYKGYFWRWK